MDLLELYSKQTSECCGARARIVRSRDGGMVSQNCTRCGKPNYVRPADFPPVQCAACGTLLVIKKQDGTNYYFVCAKCNTQAKIADLVPDWSDLFVRHGLAAFGDDIPNS